VLDSVTEQQYLSEKHIFSIVAVRGLDKYTKFTGL